ncbi:unnamed protein product [Chrysoparadoxa australica]
MWGQGGGGSHAARHGGGGSSGGGRHHNRGMGTGWGGPVVVVDRGWGWGSRGSWDSGWSSRRRGPTVVHGSGLPCGEGCCCNCCRPAPRSAVKRRGCCYCFALFALVFAPILTLIKNHSTDITLDSRETRLVHSSTLFCKGITIEDPSDQLSIYGFEVPPPLSKVDDFSVQRSFHLAADGYEYLAYYLNAGSSWDVQFTSGAVGVEFLVFRGDSDFNRWKAEGDETFILKKWVSGGQTRTQHFKVGKREAVYYLVFDNPAVRQTAEVSVQLQVHRLSFDISGYQKACTAPILESCQVSLPFTVGALDYPYYGTSHPKPTLICAHGQIIEAPDNDDEDVFDLSLVCHPRWQGYRNVFGSILGGCLALVGLSWCWKKKSSRRSSAGGGEEAMLLANRAAATTDSPGRTSPSPVTAMAVPVEETVVEAHMVESDLPASDEVDVSVLPPSAPPSKA